MTILNHKDSSVMFVVTYLGNSILNSLSSFVWFGYIFSQNHPKNQV